jgi:hypothetical protein
LIHDLIPINEIAITAIEIIKIVASRRLNLTTLLWTKNRNNRKSIINDIGPNSNIDIT